MHIQYHDFPGMHCFSCQSRYIFAEPTPYPGALHVAASPHESRLDHTGAWRCLSPEELHHAMIFAIADAVRTQPNNHELLID